MSYFSIDLIIIAFVSLFAILLRIEGRKEKNRIVAGDLKAEDFEIIEE